MQAPKWEESTPEAEAASMPGPRQPRPGAENRREPVRSTVSQCQYAVCGDRMAPCLTHFSQLSRACRCCHRSHRNSQFCPLFSPFTRQPLKRRRRQEQRRQCLANRRCCQSPTLLHPFHRGSTVRQFEDSGFPFTMLMTGASFGAAVRCCAWVSPCLNAAGRSGRAGCDLCRRSRG